MTLSGFTSVVSRRLFVAVALGASLFVGSNAWAQAAAGAPAAPAQTDNFKFTSESAVMIYGLKPEKIAAFETMWKSILTKLAASDKPGLKELAASLKIYKVDGTPAGQPQMYFFTADPASKTNSYNITTLLFDPAVGLFTRAEADALWTPVGSDAFATINSIPTVKLQP